LKETCLVDLPNSGDRYKKDYDSILKKQNIVVNSNANTNIRDTATTKRSHSQHRPEKTKEKTNLTASTKSESKHLTDWLDDSSEDVIIDE